MSNIITFNNPLATTDDRRYTHRDLENKIMKMCKTRYGSRYGQAIGKSVINSFVSNGIIEIYNDIGYDEWIKLVTDMMKSEMEELYGNHEYGRNTNVCWQFPQINN